MEARLQLVRLLEQLRDVRSPLVRMRILAQGWKTLRSLDRVELRRLAGQLGFDGADQLLARLARGRGKVDVEFFSDLLDRARGLDRDEVDAVAEGLRDPARRRALLNRSLDFVTEEWSDEDQDSSPIEGTGSLPPTPAEPTAVRSSPAPDTAPAAPARAERASPTAEPEPEAVKPRIRSVQAPQPAAEARSVEVGAAERPLSRDREPAARRSEPSASAGPPVEALTPAAAVELIDRVREPRYAIRRLVALRDHVEDARALDLEELRTLLGIFPDGWARRRALSLLLARRIPGNLHQAVFLVEGLESKSAERWCVGTILEHWDLTARERRALIERHGLAPIRARRLGLVDS